MSEVKKRKRNVVTIKRTMAAYEFTGLKPKIGSFGDGKTCGCPLMAIAAHEMKLRGDFPDGWTSPEEIRDIIGLSDGYFNGFIRGFDVGMYLDETFNSTAVKHGRSVRKAVDKMLLSSNVS